MAAAEDDVDLLELVQRARRGDTAALSCLVESHLPALSRFCLRLVGDAPAAEDLAQETVLRAYQSLGRLEEPSRFGAWLFGITANLR